MIWVVLQVKWEAMKVLSKEHDLMSYQDHDDCCVDSGLKCGKAKVETERLITRLLQ